MKVELLTLPSGALKWGVFARLNTSARNCALQRSVTGISLNRPASRLMMPGANTARRFMLPRSAKVPVRRVTGANADLSNHWSGDPIFTTFGLMRSPVKVPARLGQLHAVADEVMSNGRPE